MRGRGWPRKTPAQVHLRSFIGSSPAPSRSAPGARAAATESTVLLLGETGTGKDIARAAIHAASTRGDTSHLSASIWRRGCRSLIEAEFFAWHPRVHPAPSGKQRPRQVKLPTAARCSSMKSATCRLCCRPSCCVRWQQQEIEALGSNEVVKIDVRVIARTSRDLQALVEAGSFRARSFFIAERAADPRSRVA